MAGIDCREISPKETALVQKIASTVYYEYCPAGEKGEITKEDLFHCGIVGLLDAAKRFNKELNVPFTAFAAMRIRGEMIDLIRRPFIRIPQEPYREVIRLKKKKEEFLNIGQTPDSRTLSRELGWDDKKLRKIEALSVKIMPMDAGPETGRGFDSIFNASDGAGPEDMLMKKELAGLVKKCLEAMNSAKERLVLVSRVLKEMTLKQVARIMGCSIETVRLKQKNAENSMKKCLSRNGWGIE